VTTAEPECQLSLQTRLSAAQQAHWDAYGRWQRGPECLKAYDAWRSSSESDEAKEANAASNLAQALGEEWVASAEYAAARHESLNRMFDAMCYADRTARHFERGKGR